MQGHCDSRDTVTPPCPQGSRGKGDTHALHRDTVTPRPLQRPGHGVAALLRARGHGGGRSDTRPARSAHHGRRRPRGTAVTAVSPGQRRRGWKGPPVGFAAPQVGPKAENKRRLCLAWRARPSDSGDSASSDGQTRETFEPACTGVVKGEKNPRALAAKENTLT